ncbi:MAG: hypothetical protein NPIRA02_20590 [Nitrospirales bacterium]|nr:MAG: hypothetical protein NPIRA02_20590 [Nitrospirales bacterium]
MVSVYAQEPQLAYIALKRRIAGKRTEAPRSSRSLMVKNRKLDDVQFQQLRLREMSFTNALFKKTTMLFYLLSP